MRSLVNLSALLIAMQVLSQPIYVTRGYDLYVIDAIECTVELIGSPGLTFLDIAQTPNGRLFATRSLQLYELDTSTAEATLIGDLTNGGNALVDLNDSVLLLMSGFSLYGIDVNDASSWLIGEIGYASSGDLTWFGDHLYLKTGGMLVRIELSPDHSSVVSSIPINDFDESMPTTQALATVLLGENRSSIVGHTHPELICYSPIDGSYEAICQLDLPGNISGAASVRIPVASITGCHDIVESIEEGVNDGFQIFRTAESIEVLWSDQIEIDRVILFTSGGQHVLVPQGRSHHSASIMLTSLTSGLYVLQCNGPLLSRSIKFSVP